MSLIKNQAAAQAIAEFLADGIEHPGDPETKTKPVKLSIPMFRVLGKPPPYSDATREANQTIGEAIVHLIESKLDYTIIPNTDLATLIAVREELNAARQIVSDWLASSPLPSKKSG